MPGGSQISRSKYVILIQKSPGGLLLWSKNLLANARNRASIPGLGRSYTHTMVPTLHHKRSHCSEKPEHSNEW